MARDVYKQGLASVRYFIWLLVVAGLVFCLATAMLLDTVVLSRLSRLGALARRIGATGDLSARVLLPGRDELSELSREINSMLESLEQTQRSLRLSEEKFRDIFAESPIGIVLYDAAGRLVNVNLACLSIFGVYDVADVKGISLFDDPSVSDEIKDRLRKGETVQYETILDLDKVRQRNLYKTEKTGSIFLDVHITSLGTKGAEPFSGYLVQVQDITERKRMEEELRAVSLVDELTALYNRRGFFTLAAQQLKVAHRMNRTALLLFADLDGMKWINDTLGHSEGDQALKEIAGILKRNCRESDIVARTGGDEFAILAIEARMEATEFLIARLQDKIKEHNAKGINRFTLSLSIGTAHYDPEEPCSLDELLARADTLMYERKRAKSGFWNQRQP